MSTIPQIFWSQNMHYPQNVSRQNIYWA